jgi:hypothetical protein
MLEKLMTKSLEELKVISRWEFDKLIIRGATGMGITSTSDVCPKFPRTEEDKKSGLASLIVHASMMNKEDCNKDETVMWEWEE